MLIPKSQVQLQKKNFCENFRTRKAKFCIFKFPFNFFRKLVLSFSKNVLLFKVIFYKQFDLWYLNLTSKYWNFFKHAQLVASWNIHRQKNVDFQINIVISILGDLRLGILGLGILSYHLYFHASGRESFHRTSNAVERQFSRAKKTFD